MAYLPGSALPPAASDRVEFISQIHATPSTELAPTGARGIDVSYLRRYVRALEDAGFDYTLLPYGSSGADSFVLASAVGQLSDVIKLIVAVRPNTTFPQARQGDYLPKDQRYARTAEFLQLLRRAWTERAAFARRGAERADAPQNVGSQQALAFAAQQEFFDRALWTRTAAATNAGGAATALVGSPETVAAAIVDYIDLGASLVSIRGYDRYVLPLVRAELAHRKATGLRGALQADHPGHFGGQFAAAARA
jgi:alkanesulfonate monooxygenase SsuD/methylene tetrahydromethanopterin reductase-like flavin-dependent oxidoreductase (luciferase family)